MSMTGFSDYAAFMRAKPCISAKLTCGCGKLLPIEELYFSSSDHKFALACRECTQQVIDTYYCPSCLNSFFSSMAFQGKNRCPQCANCPSCGVTLGAVAKEGGSLALRCEFCKWTSESIGLTAPTAAALFEALKEHEDASEGAKEFERLVTLYGAKASKAQFDPKDEEPVPYKKDKDRINDVQAAVGKIETALETSREALFKLPKEPVVNEVAAGTDSSNKGCTLAQKLANTGADVAPDQLWPKNVQLLTKLARRGADGRYVVKPQAGANKTSFDIANLLLNVLPRTTLSTLPELKKGEAAEFMIKFKNPLDVPVTLQFATVDTTIAAKGAAEAQRAADEEAGVLDDDEEAVEQYGGVVAAEGQAELSFPEASVEVAAFDEIADQNDLFANKNTSSEADDPNVVGYRKLSTVGVKVKATPTAEEGDVLCSLVVKVTTKPPERKADSADVLFNTFSYQLTLNLGPVSS